MKKLAILTPIFWAMGLALAAPSDGITAGDRAQDFTLNDVRTGKAVSLSSYRDARAVAVVFIGTQCPYSNAYNHVMAELADRYGSKGVVFVGINANKTEPLEQVRAHAEQHGLDFTVLKDEGSSVADRFGATVTPEVFLLDPSWNVVYHGALGNSHQPTSNAEKTNGEELGAALDAFLSGQPVARPTTKMFGCSIKR
jgi:peroxiredoxin